MAIHTAFQKSSPIVCVLKTWLFGSYSRGEERPDSDVDILVEYDRSQRIGLFKISAMHQALEKLLERKVDLVDETMLFPWVSNRVNQEKELLVHGYYQVNANDVWDVIQSDLEPLQRQVEELLQSIDWEEWEKKR